MAGQAGRRARRAGVVAQEVAWHAIPAMGGAGADGACEGAALAGGVQQVEAVLAAGAG